MAGRKQKLVSDPKHAHPHNAGASVVLTQFAVDPIYGAIAYPVFDHTDFYFKAAEAHLKDADQLLSKVREIPLSKSNSRFVEIQLMAEFFHHAQLVLIFGYLGLEYFAMSCAQGLGKTEKWKHRGLDQKIKDFIPKEIGIPKLPQDLCNAFGELENRRHSLNHPSWKNVMNSSETEWDSAHVSWLVIGNYQKAYAGVKKIYAYLHEPYKAEMTRRHPPTPVTLTGIKRGIRFENQSKKPPEK